MNKDKSSERITRDSLFDGRVICYQPVHGYRFSIDAILLAHFPQIKKGEKILDLGTGCGIIALILCYRYPYRKIAITGIEIQSDLCQLADRNSSENCFTDQFQVIHGDIRTIRTIEKPEQYSLVISNPPFYNSGRGRLSKNVEKSLARHQFQTTCEDFVSAASFCAGNRCRVVMIYPADQICQIMRAFDKHALAVKKLRFIYSFADDVKPAKLVLLEGVKNGGQGTTILPVCSIYREPGNDQYSAEVDSFYQP